MSYKTPYKKKRFQLSYGAKKGLLFLGFAAAGLGVTSQCTDEEGTRDVLKKNGMKPIEVGGHAWFAGDKDDYWATKFKAVTANGDTITGSVTKGILKGKTIRYD